jgi:hypothetical protein
MCAMGGKDSQNWLDHGEKYALLGLSIKYDERAVKTGPLAPELAVLTRAAFKMPSHWREWLGTIRAEEVEDCDLFILSKCRSQQPAVLDGENQMLQLRVRRFYVGLLLASTFATAHKPVILTGSREDEEIDVRQTQDLDSPVPNDVRPYPEVALAEFEEAGRIAAQLELSNSVAQGPSHWRLFREIHLYTETRTRRDLLDRVHQYARCVEGLLLCDQGKSGKQFKSRSELFIGPGHHEMMGQIYDMRSKVEHLHEDQLLEPFDREVRLDIMKKEAIIEHIARTALNRIVSNTALWTHFANRTALSAFWAVPAPERQKIWGAPIDPLGAVADFDPKYIHDRILGA